MYNWNAEDYYKSSEEQQKWARELISKLSLNGNEKVLDIGCGDGKVTAEIANVLSYGFVLGIDNSKEMIEFANKNFPKEKFPNLSFMLIDAKELNYNEKFNYENWFDIVFSNAALHWIIDHLPVLKGIERVLKPSGKVLLQMGGKGNANDVIEIMNEIIRKEKWKKYFLDFSFPYGFYDVDDYKNFLKQTCLKAIRIELIAKEMNHKSIEKFTGWIRTTWMPYTQKVPQKLRDEFIDEIVNMYITKHPPDKNGHVRVKMVRLEVEAEK